MLSFREVEPSDARLLFDWRQKPHVASMMATVMSNDFEAHTRWVERAYENAHYYHWVFGDATGDKGLLSFADIRMDDKSCSMGFYTGDENFGQLGALVPAFALNFLLREKSFTRVTGEVLSTNESVLRMHDVLGYQRTPERDYTILRGDENLTLVTYEMNAETWAQQTRFHRWVASFPTAHWSKRPEGF